MSAHKQYDSLKRKQKHYEQARWDIARIVDCNFDNKTKFVTLTEDILHDLQKENIVFQKEYTRQIYDTNAFLSTGSCLKDSSVIYIKIKKENPCVKGESYG